MYLVFENRTEMVQKIRDDLARWMNREQFDIEQPRLAQMDSLELTVTEVKGEGETLDFNFNEPFDGEKSGGWNAKEDSPTSSNYNIQIAMGDGLSDRANAIVITEKQADGTIKVSQTEIGLIVQLMVDKIKTFFRFASKRLHNIDAESLADYESGGWSAGYNDEGDWRLRKEANGKEYFLYADPYDNTFDPPSINHRWMACFPDVTSDDGRNAVGITLLDKAKLVLEWHIMANAPK